MEKKMRWKKNIIRNAWIACNIRYSTALQ